MKLVLVFLAITVAGCFARPHLSQRRFWEEPKQFNDEEKVVEPLTVEDDSEEYLENDQDLLNLWKRRYEKFEQKREQELFRNIISEGEEDVFDEPVEDSKEPEGENDEPEEKTEEPEEETEEPEEHEEETEEPGEETEEPEEETEEPEGKSKEKLLESSENDETIWLFNEDYSEEVSGSLAAGAHVLIVYDAARLLSHVSDQPEWNISAEFMFNGGKVHEQKLEGPDLIEGHEIMGTKLFIPFGTTTLTIWFKLWGNNSGYSYDSDYGKNYEQAVTPPAETTIAFEKDYAENVYGDLERGGEFQVYYSTERLEVNEGFHLYAVAKYSENAEAYTKHELTYPKNGYYVTSFNIPDDAEEVIMWFYTKKGDEHNYDSNYGANYHFALSS